MLNALAFAVIAAVLAPCFAEISWPGQRWSIGRRSALAIVLFAFWGGFLDFPLSDFPALTMALLALVAISHCDEPGWTLTAGLACGAAVDMRPSYLLLVPILPVLMVWGWRERRRAPRASAGRRAACMGLLVAGLLLVSLPQSLASHRHFGTWSFVPGAADHLTALQLTDGMFLQLYDTYVGPGHPPQMNYLDVAGSALLAKQNHQVVAGVGQYLGLVATAPITMGELLVRHVINGLDQRYSTPYVGRIDNHRWLRLVGFVLMFLAAVRLLWPAARRSLGAARWRYPVALAACCATSVPSAMETRYLLPIFLLGYILVLAPGWPNPVGPAADGMRRYRPVALIAVAGAASLLVFWHVVSETTRHLHLGT